MYLNCDTREEAEMIRDAADGKISNNIGHKATGGKVKAILKCDFKSFSASRVTDVKVSSFFQSISIQLEPCPLAI